MYNKPEFGTLTKCTKLNAYIISNILYGIFLHVTRYQLNSGVYKTFYFRKDNN